MILELIKYVSNLIKLPLKRKRAFTLVELLIVIAIIVMMAAVTIPAYQNYGAKSDISLKADEIKNILDRAKAYSNNPPQDKDCAQVIFTSSRISIQFGNYVSGNTGCTVDSAGQATKYAVGDYINIPSYMTVTPVITGTGDQINYIYSYYPGMFNIAGGGTDATITISSTKTSRSAEILLKISPYSTKINIQ